MCFGVHDACFYCPNFWAIKLEVLLCSTASIKFNYYFQFQQSWLLLCYYGWSLLLRQEMLSSAFVRQGRHPAIQADGPEVSAALAPWIFCVSATPRPPPVGKQLQHTVRHYKPQRPSPGGFWGQQEFSLVQKGPVWWLLSCGEGPEPCAGEWCFSGWDLPLLRLESYIPSLNGKLHPGKKCILELTVSTFLHKSFSNRLTCKP